MNTLDIVQTFLGHVFAGRMEQALALAERLKAAGTAFILEPQVRFEDEPGEQWTMFFTDPCGNPIEVKGFASLDGLYAR